MIPVNITWHGHSCFSIENNGKIVVLDPYHPMAQFPPLAVAAHAMLASHQHGDHNYRQAVRFLPASEGVLRPAATVQDVPAQPEPGVFFFRTVETSHDDDGGSKRGSNLVHIVHVGGLTIAHLGDLGHVLQPEQAEAIGRPDLLLIPVGGFYTIDAAAAWQVVAQLQPQNIAPMHYDPGTGKLPISSVEPFLRLAPAGWTVEHLTVPKLVMTGQTPVVSGRCLVFQYQPGI
jgi:L-ascorbate metabolism protein UlaG (beta-lactamase superfamily)